MFMLMKTPYAKRLSSEFLRFHIIYIFDLFISVKVGSRSKFVSVHVKGLVI